MWESRIAWPAGPTLVCLVLLAGCDSGLRTDYGQLGLAEVRGSVTLDGTPLAGAVVIFEASDRTYSYGRTDSAGRYHLSFNSEKSGVLPGAKTVRIRTAGGLDEGESAPAEGEGNSGPGPQELVPACYNGQSKLQVTVAGRWQTFNFDLRSDCSTGSPP